MQNIDQIQAGVNNYNQVRQPGDIDLIEEVRNILLSAGLHNNVSAFYDTNINIQEARNRPSNIQRFILNRYWNHQLLLSSANSMDQRYCLIPNGEIVDWIKLFKESVLPFIIENNLPR